MIRIPHRHALPEKASGVAYAYLAINRSQSRLDLDSYLVLEHFSSGPAWRETEEDRTDYQTLISDLFTGQYDQPLRVVAFNPFEGWSRDASEDVAQELERRVVNEQHEITEALWEFIDVSPAGRPACN
jgi:hypothetical protein